MKLFEEIQVRVKRNLQRVFRLPASIRDLKKGTYYFFTVYHGQRSIIKSYPKSQNKSPYPNQLFEAARKMDSVRSSESVVTSV